MIKEGNNVNLAVPSEYLENSNELCDLFNERIENDSVGLSPYTVKNRKASVKKMRPILDAIGIYKLNQLQELEVLIELRRAVGKALSAGKLGRGGTPDTHISNFITLCGRVGLPNSDVQNLKGILKQSYKDADIEETPKVSWDAEMIGNIIRTSHEWLASKPVKNKGNHWSYIDLPYGYRNVPLSPTRFARVLAWAALQMTTGARAGAINRIRRRDITKDSVTWKIRKGRRKTQPETSFIPESIQPLLKPILKLDLEANDFLFNVPKGDISEDCQTKSDLRALLLASGIPQHLGRTGLHGARSAMVEANRKAGNAASVVGPALGHRDTRTAEIH